MEPPRLPHVLIAIIAVLLAADAAQARVDIEVRNRARVRGSLIPGADVERIRTEMPAGARYTAIVRPIASGVDPDPRFIDFHVRRAGAEHTGFGQADRFGTKSVIKDGLVSATGLHTIEVASRGAAPGDYQLDLRWKTPRTVRFESTRDDPLSTAVVSGERGGSFTVEVKATRSSSARPRVAALRIVDGAALAAFVPSGNTGARRHRVKVMDLPQTADYAIDVRDLTAGDEPFSIVVKRKRPRARRRKFDVRSALIGPTRSGREFARCEYVDASGGVVTSVADAAQIGGARVGAPPGALRDGTSVQISTAAAIEQIPNGATEPLSATIRFVVIGRSPRAPLQYTIPFETAGLDGVEGLRVTARDEQGRETLVSPGELTVIDDEVSFGWPVPATFRVFGSTLVPPNAESDLNGDGVSDLVIPTFERADQVVNDVRVFFGGPGAGPATSDEADSTLIGNENVSVDGHPLGTGDLDGDGIADLAVFMPSSGGIHVHLGGPEFAGSRSLYGTAQLIVTPPEDVRVSSLGSSVAIGDVIGTAADDLIVRVESKLPNSLANSHYRLEIYAGGSLFARTAQRGPDVVLDGFELDDEFGNALAVGDVSGDGRADVVAGVADLHRVVVFFGGPTLTGRKADAADVTYTGEEGQFRFGNGVAVGDLTGDGVGDVVAAKSGGGLGRVYLFPGGIGIADTPAARAETLFTTEVDRTAATFAERIAVGDVTGDGIDDLMLKEGKVAGNGFRDTVYVFRGGVAQPIRRINAADFEIDGRPSHPFGDLLRTLDVDGDGNRDLILGDTEHDGEFEDEGAVFVVPGGTGFAPFVDTFFATPFITGTSFRQYFGVDDF